MTRCPSFEDDPCLKQATEEFGVQALVAQLVVEAFDVGVLPRLRLTLRAAFGRLSRCARFPRRAGLR